eukprot:1021150-Lingulodinium_polyedra.AAC.1
MVPREGITGRDMGAAVVNAWRAAKEVAKPEEGLHIGIFDYGPNRCELKEASEVRPKRISYGRYVAAVKYLMQLPPLGMSAKQAARF